MKKQKKLIYSEPWDYLIVLDACRYDSFEYNHKAYFEGELEKVESLSNHTADWFRKTFKKSIPAVYYSCNPNVNRKTTNRIFQSCRELWNKDWDDKEATVMPEKVNEIILSEKPKKAVIHYIQPHYPYVASDFKYDPPLVVFMIKNNIRRKTLVEAYRENLKNVLSHVQQLAKGFPNKKIYITADHGELLGEDYMYLHMYPDEIYIPLLREVPWFEVKGVK